MSQGHLTEPLPIFDLTTPADADQALKTITVAKAAEKAFARAKDASQLYAAVKAKLVNQAVYAVLRQDVHPPSQTVGGPGRGKKRIAEQRSVLPALDPGKDVIARWRERLCAKTAGRWAIDEAKLAAALEEAQRRCLRICEQENMGTVRGTEGTGEFERYTPAKYIDKVREALGAIDLDPASCKQAQRVVRATDYFTLADDGLACDWHGRVFLNPPYHRDLVARFVEKLIAELGIGHVDQAILLTNNSTDTSWCQRAIVICDVFCLTDGRINFDTPGGAPVIPTQGQAFFYFGPYSERFIEVFTPIGVCASRRPIDGGAGQSA